MTRGLPLNTGDENIEGGSYDSAPKGLHKVIGIKEFFDVCMTDTGPIFVETNGELKIKLEFLKEDGSKGPTYSATPAEFLALADVFGAKLDKFDITRKNRTSPAIILAVKDAINAAGKAVDVVANEKGWVGRLDQMHLPLDTKYTVRFKEAIGKDKTLAWFPSEYGGYLILKFTVVADGRGNPTMWEGYDITIFLNNDFVKEAVVRGERMVAADLQRPLYTSSTGGGVPASAMRWTNFAMYFAPDVLEHEWAVNPASSEYNVCEVHEPQYVFMNKARSDRDVVVFYHKVVSRKTKKVSYQFDLNDLVRDNDAETPQEPEEDVQQGRALDALLAYISENKERWGIAPEIDLFEVSPLDSKVIMFTDAGKAWAEQHLLVAWQAAGLGDRKPLHELNEKESGALLVALIAVK